MNVAPTAATLSLLAPVGTAAPTPAWQVGQQLTAMVIAQSSANTLTLRIGAQTVEANTSAHLALNSTLKLEVVATTPQPVLRIIPPQTEDAAFTNALRAVLPRQLPLQEIFTQLTALHQGGHGGFPGPAMTALKQLLEQLPGGGTRLSADSIKHALSDAGIFLEKRLSQTDAERLSRDTKANLLRLLAALGEDNPESSALRRTVSAGLARIELHQLMSLAEDKQAAALSAELPLRHNNDIDVFQLRIEQDANKENDAASPAWTVWLSFELPDLGLVRAKIGVQAEQVSSTLWAEHEQGAELIRRNLDWLERALTESGLSIAKLQCRTGCPPNEIIESWPTQLVDTKA